MTALATWIEKEYAVAARELARSVSPVGLSYNRAAFHQTVTAAAGSVVASPVPGAYDPDPDYFFHWLRDSALTMDAVRALADEGTLANGDALLSQFLSFSLSLLALDGRTAARPDPARIAPEFARHLRSADALAAVHGDAVLAEARYNPDGTLDVLNWARPQLDGPALRALTLLRAWPRLAGNEDARALLAIDIAFVARHAFAPSYDIWEEDLGAHYYTRLVSAAALDEGAKWLAARGGHVIAARARETAQALLAHLDTYWDATRGHYRAHLEGERRPELDKDLDVSVLLAALHGRRASGPHSVFDPKIEATVDRLCARFATDLEINEQRQGAPALGRYRGDVYFGGGAWYLATLAAAEFHYERGALAKGDAFMETVRALTPDDGALSEQVDRTTGVQTSAKHLGWSYAAFISARAARRRALARAGGAA